jgi:hypothetical protein
MLLRCSGCTDLEKCKAQAVPITPTKCGGKGLATSVGHLSLLTVPAMVKDVDYLLMAKPVYCI